MRTAVKICGITTREDAEMVLELGAEYLGFVFAPSVRRIAPGAAAEIIAGLKSSGRLGAAKTVAVFVNETPERMTEILALSGIDLAQIHGDETPRDCQSFVFPWYRALRVSASSGIGDIAAWTCPRLLFDAAVPGMYGGSGTLMDRAAALSAIASARGIASRSDRTRSDGARSDTTRRGGARGAGPEIFVAGGIRPENVADIVTSLRPDGIDVGSGVEERPGRKSAEKLAALFRALEGAQYAGE